VIVNDLLNEYRTPTNAIMRSGAKIEPIDSHAALAFLEQSSAIDAVRGYAGAAWGAFAADATLVGVAALSISGPTPSQAYVAIVPECRRHRVGSDLMEVLMHEVQGRHLRALSCTCASADPGPQQFLKSLHMTVARRVTDHTGVIVLVVPDPTPPNHRGDQ
jgi:GNAT superfamily N-acetyltransferase